MDSLWRSSAFTEFDFDTFDYVPDNAKLESEQHATAIQAKSADVKVNLWPSANLHLGLTCV